MSPRQGRIGGHVLWNLAGQGAPIIAAIACIPVLSGALGADRFGLLVLSWTVVGYFSIFDLGLTVAMERSVARHLGGGEHDAIPVTVWTTLTLMLGLGTAACVAAWIAAAPLIHALRTSQSLQGEALTTMHLLALSIPLVMATVALRGVLAAHMRFRRINLIGVPMGLWTYLAPLALIGITHSLVAIVAALFAGRLLELVLFAVSALRTVPAMRRPSFHGKLVRPLITFGGWLALDDAVGPVTGILDRFLVGGMVSVAAVAYYAVPYQLAAQGWILASSLSAVLFPLFSAMLAGESSATLEVFRRCSRTLALVIFPVALLMVGLARPALQLWLGAAYARNSSGVLQLIATGVLLSSIGSVGGTLNGSAGRPDLNAKLGLAKFALHVAPIWWVLPSFGIAGLAALWCACVAFEAVGMLLFALRRLGESWRGIAQEAGRLCALLAALAAAAVDAGPVWKASVLSVVLIGTGAVAWRTLRGSIPLAALRERIWPRRPAVVHAVDGGT